MAAYKRGGGNYWEMYAPVVNWESIQIILAVAKTHGLSSMSIDCVLAFPQADLKIPVYTVLPLGFNARYSQIQMGLLR
jgi:hypothetical protein